MQKGYFALNPTGDYWSNDFNAGLVASYLGFCAAEKHIAPDGFAWSVAPMVSAINTAWYPSWNPMLAPEDGEGGYQRRLMGEAYAELSLASDAENP